MIGFVFVSGDGVEDIVVILVSSSEDSAQVILCFGVVSGVSRGVYDQAAGARPNALSEDLKLKCLVPLANPKRTT